MARTTRKKAAKAEKAEKAARKPEPGIIPGEVNFTTDDYVVFDFGTAGWLKLARRLQPTRFAKGQVVTAQISIDGNAPQLRTPSLV